MRDIDKILAKVQEHLGELVVLRIDTVSSDSYNLVAEDKFGGQITAISIGIREVQLHNTLNAINRLLDFKTKQEVLEEEAFEALHPEL